MKSVTGRVFVAVGLLALSVAAYPNHLKAVVVDSDPVPVVPVVKQIVPVVSAKADVNSGGVYASADSPFGSVGAGVPAAPGGVYASADSPFGSVGAGVPAPGGGSHSVKPGHNQPGLFDGIFNIPISVLQAVNTYLNNRGPVNKPARRRGHQPQPAAVDKSVEHTGTESHAEAGAEAGAEASGSSSSASAGAHSGQGPVVIQKRVNYDDIFNIPISVLKSVNHLLNG